MTNAELVAEIEKLFDCRTGLAGPYAVGDSNSSHRYATFSMTTRAGNPEDLRRWLLDTLKAFATTEPSKRVLFWRYAPDSRIEESVWEDDNGTRVHDIHTRIAIPGAWTWPAPHSRAEGTRRQWLEGGTPPSPRWFISSTNPAMSSA